MSTYCLDHAASSAKLHDAVCAIARANPPPAYRIVVRQSLELETAIQRGELDRDHALKALRGAARAAGLDDAETQDAMLRGEQLARMGVSVRTRKVATKEAAA